MNLFINIQFLDWKEKTSPRLPYMCVCMRVSGVGVGVGKGGWECRRPGVHARMYACENITQTHTQQHTPRIHTHARARARTHTHTHTHARTLAHTRTLVHTHKHTRSHLRLSHLYIVHMLDRSAQKVTLRCGESILEIFLAKCQNFRR